MMEEDVAVGQGGLSRRSLIKRGALLGGAVMWASPVVQSFTTPAFAAGTPAPAQFEGCMFNGGGQVRVGNVVIAGGDRGGGFTLRCGEPLPDNLTVRVGRKTYVVRNTATVECDNTPGSEPDPPDEDFDTVIVTGVADITAGGTGTVPIEITMIDRGEPGRFRDVVVRMVIDGQVVLENALVTAGNFQALCPGAGPG